MYGKRDGVLPGLAVVSRTDKSNLFRKSAAFKTGVVHGVSMLGRQHMVKPEVSSLQFMYDFCPFNDVSLHGPQCNMLVVLGISIITLIQHLWKWTHH